MFNPQFLQALWLRSGHSQFPHVAQAVFERGFGHFQVVVRLQIQPILRALPKGLAQAQRKFGSHGAFLSHQMRNAHRRNAKGLCQRRLRYAKIFQRFANVFAGVNSCRPLIVRFMVRTP